MEHQSTLSTATDDDIRRGLEAILMVVDSPASAVDLATALEVPVQRVDDALQALRREYEEQCRGFELRNVADGWRFYSAPQFDGVVKQFIVGNHTQKLSQAALETLAVVAYRQPVTRAKVSAIRGVNVDSVIRNLVLRGLIEDAGETASGATLFRTTSEFLERMGLTSLDELAPLAPYLPAHEEIHELSLTLEDT
ncbi:MAG: SMC-Scp complex subunit ScpB [Actinomycetaceae bacterium]|nr:SMC-Scp complex subunit ScpB [Actinomycetaceae bacterium]